MKSFIFTLAFLVPVVASAQQGTVLYEERVAFEIELPPEMEHMRDRIPTENLTSRQLFFDGDVSVMRLAPEDDEPTQLEADSRGMRFRMMSSRAEDETYTNHGENVQIEKRDFLERTFLITEEPLRLAWRLTGEQAEFLGYVSQKAVATTESGTVVEAWFTPQIAAPVGPGRYGGLPGLILLLTEDGDRRSFVAKEVVLDDLPEGAIAIPTRGRDVTREDFEALVEERMREMGGRRGGIRFHMRN